MASPRVLVVDNDRSSLGLLTHVMNRFGLNSSGVANLEEARAVLASQRPDVVVSEVGSGPGLKVLEEMRRNPATRDIPVVFLAKGAWARRRAHARELGAQELIAKPAYVQDVAVLTWLYAGRSASDPLFEGSFGEPSCAALLRGLLAGGRTGTLQLEPFGATVRFREGAIVDAALPPLTGERALMRILTLGTGSYELTFGALDVTPTMQFELGDLSGRGLSHVHNWEEIRSQLQPLDQILTVDYGALSSQVNELPSGLWSLLRLFDGKRTIAEVIEDSSLDELTSGQAVAKLKGLQIFEQQRNRRDEEVLGESSIEGEIGSLSIPVPAELRAQYAQYEEPPVDLPPPAPEGYADRLALDVHGRVEQSFFESPAEEILREGSRDRGTNRDGLKVGLWTVAAVALLVAVVLLLWKSIPGSEPANTAAIGPANSPVVQAAAPAPQAAAPAQPAQAAAPAPTPNPTAQAAAPVAPVANPAAPAPPTAPSELAAAAAPASAPPAGEVAAAVAPTSPQGETAQAAPANVEPSNPAVNTLLAEGQKNYDKGRFQKALTIYEQANGIAPNDPAVALGRGLTYYELGDLDHAAAALTRVLELDSKSARAELMLGAIAQERRQNDMAKQHYKRYLELDPQGEHAAETRKLLTHLGG